MRKPLEGEFIILINVLVYFLSSAEQLSLSMCSQRAGCLGGNSFIVVWPEETH